MPPFFLVYGIALWFVSRGEREALKRQKALEKARMEAEQANSAKSEFLAVMSHEIRTPLSGIVGLTDLLIEDAETPERRSKHLMVRSACDNLLRVVDDVLDLSKIEAGAMVIAPSMTHMPLFTEALLGLYAPRARAKGVRIIADVDRSVPQQVFVDGTRLSQILGNLLGNAVKFTAEGRVDLHLRTEALAQDDRSGGQAGTLLLIARVSDTGPGMSAEKLAGLFRRYEQGDATTQKNFGGTGLGLFICAELCRLMGGRIKASSSEGNGSQFEVQLPVRLTAEPVVAKADPIASATDQDDSAGGADRALSTSGAGPQDADSDGAGAQDATNPEAEQTPADHAGRTAPGNGKAAVSPAGPDADA
ncbi:MAG: sensor histidine kinase, partial [Rhodospirillaceae bacterium]